MARQKLDEIRESLSRQKARKDSIEEILSHRAYTTEAVKRLFTAIEHGQIEGFRPSGVSGMLADFVEVADPAREKACEEFLHDELEYVVVGGWSEGECGVDLLRAGSGVGVVERGTRCFKPIAVHSARRSQSNSVSA
jgi:chromosome segregation protein